MLFLTPPLFVCAGFWTFLFFVSFCFLTNSWSNTDYVPKANSKNPVQAAIAFTFFSIFTWVRHRLHTRFTRVIQCFHTG